MVSRVLPMLSMSSSLVFALVHSALGLSAIIMSALSTGIGSVGISALPILVTICFISGYFVLSNFSPIVVASVIWLRLVPCDMLNSAAKSPSSRFGMNSPPSFENAARLITNAHTAPTISSRSCFIAQERTGSYQP